MKDCLQNLFILLLVIVLICGVTNYVKNIKTINYNLSNFPYINNDVIQQDYTEPQNVYPIDSNIVNNDEINDEDLNENYHIFVPEDNDTIIENNNQTENNKFNYIKEFSDDFHSFNPNEIHSTI